MGITVTPQPARKGLSMSELLGIFERTPMVQEYVENQAREAEQAALQGRLRCLDDITKNGKEIAELQAKAEKQKVVTDRAHDAYIEQAQKLNELTTRITHLQNHEVRLCCSLHGEHGEEPLDTALSKLHGGLCWLVSEIVRLKDETSGHWGRDPETAAYRDRQDKLGKIKRFERYHAEAKKAYARALELRMAKVSPAALAAEVEQLLEPLSHHNYE